MCVGGKGGRRDRFCFSILEMPSRGNGWDRIPIPAYIICSTDFTMALEPVKRSGEETFKRTSNYRAHLKLIY